MNESSEHTMDLGEFLTYLGQARPTSHLAAELAEILTMRGTTVRAGEHRLAS